MILVVTGSRDWRDYERIVSELVGVSQEYGYAYRDILLINGGAPGADKLAAHAGRMLGMQVQTMYAKWGSQGKAAGAIRNRKMLDEKPHLVLAFPLPQSIGTVDCMEEAESRGIPVRVVKP